MTRRKYIKTFADVFREELKNRAKYLSEKQTSGLEKDMLKEHELLAKLTDIPFTRSVADNAPKVFVIGAAQGMDNVHEAFLLSKEIEDQDKSKKSIFITSGKIGISSVEEKKLGVPGVDANVLSMMLERYGVPRSRIITEDRSTNAYRQAVEMWKIVKKRNFSEMICVIDYWHGPRFMMTLMKEMPNVTFYTHYVNRDRDFIGSANYDYSQKHFQAPLLIAEIARIHYYFEKDMGPLGLEELAEYLNTHHREHLRMQLLNDRMRKMKYFWSKNHQDILKNSKQLMGYR